MNKKRLTALYLCMLMALNALPALVFGAAAEEGNPEQPFILESTPPEGIGLEEKEAQVLLDEPTQRPAEEPLAATDVPVLPTEEPLAATEEPAMTTEEPPAVTDGPAAPTEVPPAATEEPATPTEEPPVAAGEPAVPTEEPLTATNEPNPEASPAPIIPGNPSKALPLRKSSALMQAPVLASSMLSMDVSADKDYVNLADNPSDGVITFEIQTSGGAGTLWYAFDIYKDGVVYNYMYSYIAQPTYLFEATEPGRYSVKAFVYEAATGTELTRETEVGVSTLQVLSADPGTTSATVNDEVMWTVRTSGGKGTLNYSFLLLEEISGEYYTVESKSIDGQDWQTFRLPRIGTYVVEANVSEPSISWREKYVLSESVTVTNDSAKVEIESVYSDKNTAMINEPITWEVVASGGSGVGLEYSYQVIFNGTKFDDGLSSLDNSTSNTFTYSPQRSGSYRLDIFVRDTGTGEVFQPRGKRSGFLISVLALSRQIELPPMSATASPGPPQLPEEAGMSKALLNYTLTATS